MEAWKEGLVLPVTNGVRELTHSRQRQGFLMLRRGGTEVSHNPGVTECRQWKGEPALGSLRGQLVPQRQLTEVIREAGWWAE